MGWRDVFQGLNSTEVPERSETGSGPKENVSGLSLISVGVEVDTKPATSWSQTETEASCWWRIHYPDGKPLDVAHIPDATHREVLERHPDAIAAEPFEPIRRQPSAPMTAAEEATVLAWLALIDESDPAMIADALDQCQRDGDARSYFVGRAAVELPRPDRPPDDRRTCDQCANLAGRRCLAASRGKIVASKNYEPIRHLPHRCEGYLPGADDADRRPGRERWPGLLEGA